MLVLLGVLRFRAKNATYERLTGVTWIALGKLLTPNTLQA